MKPSWLDAPDWANYLMTIGALHWRGGHDY